MNQSVSNQTLRFINAYKYLHLLMQVIRMKMIMEIHHRIMQEITHKIYIHIIIKNDKRKLKSFEYLFGHNLMLIN
jgi:hypothetical protein